MILHWRSIGELKDTQSPEYKKWRSRRAISSTKSSTASDKSVWIKAVYHHKQNWFSQQQEAFGLNSELSKNGWLIDDK